MLQFFFEVHHPQADIEPLSLLITAESEEAARAILSKEIFFAQDIINGHLFDLVLIAADRIDETDHVRLITVKTPDGEFLQKAY